MSERLTVLCWRWGWLFGPEYVNRTRAMLARHLRIPHWLWCMTDDTRGIDSAVRCLPLPTEFANTPRCRRRMWQYSRERRELLGRRVLSIDLDMVIMDNITPLVDRPDPVVMWRVDYADVYSGSFVMFDAGALHGAYEAYARDPEGYPQRAQPRGVGSDQAMLNLWLRESRTSVAQWTERDGFCNWFGNGYGHVAHYGIGPKNPNPPKGTRIVNFGSADKAIMDEGRYPFVRQHWT